MRKQVTIYNTSTDFVYAELRARIISGQLKPGARLPETKIAAQLKVSRTPVREALRRLSAEGLVRITPNSGAKVTRPTEAEIKGSFMVREHLESTSVVSAAGNGLDRRAFSKISQIISAEKRAFAKKDIETLLDMNTAFHKAIVEISENPVLIEFVERILLRTNVYTLFFNPFDEQMELCMRQHDEILQAVRASDIGLAETLMKNHLHDSHSMLTIPKEQSAYKRNGRQRGRPRM